MTITLQEETVTKPIPTGPFDIVLMDPPWAYADTRTHASAGMARSAYNVLNRQELAGIGLDLWRQTSKNCALCMWATGPKMPEALELMKFMGFTYCTVLLTWVKRYRSGKPYSGLGHYTKSGTEFVLLGRRGKPLPRLRRDVLQILEAPVGRHSAKPPEARERIVALFGDRPRIEMFARETCPGWVSWGDEV